MRVEVSVFATLAAYLPPGQRQTGSAILELPDGSTVADLEAALNLPPDLPRLVLVNGQDADPHRRLAGGDVVTLFPPLAGGAGSEAGGTLARLDRRPVSGSGSV